jgi:type II secretion system protein I
MRLATPRACAASPMSPIRRHGTRRGVSLLESLVSLAILLISLVAINQLLDTSGMQAERIRQRSLATQLCQSKLAEIVAGVPQSGGSGEFEELPGWEWSVDNEQHEVTGVLRVRVSVRRKGDDVAAVSLDQLVLDPSKRGSAMDQAAPSGSDATGQDPSSGSSGSSGTTGSTPAAPTTGGATSRPSTGGTTAPSTGGTSRPSTGGTTTPPTGGTSRPSTGGTTAPPTGGTSRPSTGGATGGSGRPGGR